MRTGVPFVTVTPAGGTSIVISVVVVVGWPNAGMAGTTSASTTMTASSHRMGYLKIRLTL
jgi:hypothetical protein